MPTFHPTLDGLTSHPPSEAGLVIVYLVHFERAYEHTYPDGRVRRLRHYIGMTNNLDRRMAEHMNPNRSAKGARLLAAANGAGIPWKIVGWWDTGTDRSALARKIEKEMKAGRQHSRKCPVCTPATGKPRKPRMARPDWKKNKKFQPDPNPQSAAIQIQSEHNPDVEQKSGTES